MKKIILLLIFSFVLLSCDSLPVSNQVIVDLKGETPMVEFFDSIEAIPLESVNDNFVGQMFNLVVDGDEFYIVDKVRAKVCKYSNTGKLLCSIGNQGRAANEYLQLVDCRVDSVVKIATVPDFKIIEYSKDGEYLRDTSWPFSGYSFVQNEDYDYIYLGLNNLKSNCLIQRISRKTGEQHEFYPIKTDFTSSGNSFPEVQLLSDTLLFTHFFDNSVYQLVGDDVSVRHYFDLGRYAIDEDFLASKDIFAVFEQIAQRGFGSILNYTENHRYAIAMFSVQDMSESYTIFGFLDKQNSEWKWSKVSQNAQSLWNTTGVYLDGDILYFVVEPDNLLDYQSIGELVVNESVLEGLTENSNQVILKCQLK